MTESFFEELPNLTDDEREGASSPGNLPPAADPDKPLLDSLTVAEKIIGRKFSTSWFAADLLQGIALRLLNWRKKNKVKSQDMSPQEWKSFAARTAFNEIKRHHKKQKSLAEVPLDESSDYTRIESPEGQSKAEESSLTLAGWQEICTMSLRQRRSLLFHSQKLVVYLTRNGISQEEIAASVEISLGCWMEVQKRITLSDADIAELIQTEDRRNGIELSSGSIKKARVEARRKIRRVTDK